MVGQASDAGLCCPALRAEVPRPESHRHQTAAGTGARKLLLECVCVCEKEGEGNKYGHREKERGTCPTFSAGKAAARKTRLLSAQNRSVCMIVRATSTSQISDIARRVECRVRREAGPVAQHDFVLITMRPNHGATPEMHCAWLVQQILDWLGRIQVLGLALRG